MNGHKKKCAVYVHCILQHICPIVRIVNRERTYT